MIPQRRELLKLWLCMYTIFIIREESYNVITEICANIVQSTRSLPKNYANSNSCLFLVLLLGAPDSRSTLPSTIPGSLPDCLQTSLYAAISALSVTFGWQRVLSLAEFSYFYGISINKMHP
jgi:hypothetical protein